MIVLKLLYLFITSTIILYYYGMMMPADGVVYTILYFAFAVPIVLVHYLLYKKLFRLLSKTRRSAELR